MPCFTGIVFSVIWMQRNGALRLMAVHVREPNGCRLVQLWLKQLLREHQAEYFPETTNLSHCKQQLFYLESPCLPVLILPIIADQMLAHEHLHGISDDALLQRVGEGCDECFAVLFHRYFRQVFGLAFKRMHRSRLHLNFLESVKPGPLFVMN